jgi:hypothetical protein
LSSARKEPALTFFQNTLPRGRAALGVTRCPLVDSIVSLILMRRFVALGDIGFVDHRSSSETVFHNQMKNGIIIASQNIQLKNFISLLMAHLFEKSIMSVSLKMLLPCHYCSGLDSLAANAAK